MFCLALLLFGCGGGGRGGPPPLPQPSGNALPFLEPPPGPVLTRNITETQTLSSAQPLSVALNHSGQKVTLHPIQFDFNRPDGFVQFKASYHLAEGDSGSPVFNGVLPNLKMVGAVRGFDRAKGIGSIVSIQRMQSIPFTPNKQQTPGVLCGQTVLFVIPNRGSMTSTVTMVLPDRILTTGHSLVEIQPGMECHLGSVVFIQKQNTANGFGKAASSLGPIGVVSNNHPDGVIVVP